MKLPITVKHIDHVLPIYTTMLEAFRDSSVRYRVLKNAVQKLNIDASNHPVVDAVIYSDLVVNFRGTVIIAIMDLSILVKNINQTKDKWERTFYLRQGLLLIFESINVFNKQNRIIRPILNSNFPEISKLFESQFRKIREFKKTYKYDSQLLDLRNNTIGHINDDLFSFCLTLSRINPNNLKKGLIVYLNLLISLERMLDEIDTKLINKVLEKRGETLQSFMDKNEMTWAKLKIPKMLK